MSGRLIGASLGPGDPGLITMKSWGILSSATCWAYPVARPGHPSYALTIALQAGLLLPKQQLELLFPMVRDAALLAGHWQTAAQQVLEVLATGEDVVFLVEGDASSYSTFGHLERTVRSLDPKATTFAIPGVSSPLAAAASADIPLAEGDDVVTMATATNIPAIATLLTQCDTLALLKVRPLLDEIITLLEERNLLDQSVYVERVGSPNERIVRDLRQLRGQEAHYLSLLLIRCRAVAKQ